MFFERSTSNVPDGSPAWGDLKPGAILVCTKKRPVYKENDAHLSSDGSFPFGLPGEESRSDNLYKYLIPGDKLKVEKFVVTSGLNTSFDVLYVVGSDGVLIRMPFTAGSKNDPRFTAEKLKKYGFKIQSRN